MIWQYFGSEDSTDTDIVFFVAELPATIQQRSELCKACVSGYAALNEAAKKVNGNLAVLNKGQITDVYKGTADELNNALYYTYHRHKQDFDNQVKKVLSRNIDLKLIRCTRMLLSAMTRTAFRKEVKMALQSGLGTRMAVLKQIDWQQLKEPEKGFTLIDIKKLMAFQLGQSMALISGKEVYTKGDIAFCYPQLSPYLQRQTGTGTEALAAMLSAFILHMEQRMKGMAFTEE